MLEMENPLTPEKRQNEHQARRTRGRNRKINYKCHKCGKYIRGRNLLLIQLCWCDEGRDINGAHEKQL